MGRCPLIFFVSALAAAQGLDIVHSNTQKLQAQLSLDQTTYFPREAAAITIGVLNPTASAMLVVAPFNTGTGCLALYSQPPNGGTPSPLGADGPCSGFPTVSAIATTTMNAGAQRTMSLNSYDNMFDSGFPAMSSPSAAGAYFLSYAYASANQAAFSVVVPPLDAAGIVQMADESSFDPATGETTQVHVYMHVFAVRWNNVSYICVTVSPVSSNQVITADGNGNFSSEPGVYRRIATSQNPVASISATNNAGVLAIQWQDSTGATFTGSYTTQYGLTMDHEPDGSGRVFPGSSNYNPGATVNLTAVPAPGYSFSNWTGDPVASPSSASTTITMSNEFSVTAKFVSNGQTAPTNVSSQFSTATSNPSIDSADNEILESVTITNTSNQYMSGPLSLVLSSLSAGFTLNNASGTFSGSPYIRVTNYGVLSPGTRTRYFFSFPLVRRRSSGSRL